MDQIGRIKYKTDLSIDDRSNYNILCLAAVPPILVCLQPSLGEVHYKGFSYDVVAEAELIIDIGNRPYKGRFFLIREPVFVVNPQLVWPVLSNNC